MSRTPLLTIGASLLIAGFTASAALGSGKDAGEISKPYRLKVIGASLADQLATGLRWEFRGNKSFRISQNTKAATGLVRTDVYDWQAELEEIVKDERIDIAVVTLGGNDRQSFFHRGRRLRRFSVLWRAEYFKRLEKFMRTLSENVPIVYWVGLPKVRSAAVAHDYVRLNSYFRKFTAPLGATYLHIYGRFSNKAGKYSSFGESLAGRRRRLRQKDGIHFTMAGARKLGRIVGNMIRADLKARRLRSQNAASEGLKTQQ